MLAITTSVTGINENVQRMKNIQLGLQHFQIGEIINYVCSKVAAEAQMGAPVRTGTLRDSIVYYMNNELSGEVAAMAAYAYEVEYGYTAKNGKRIPGANFFRPPALRGRKLLRDELLKYTIEVIKGNKPRPPGAARGSKKAGIKTHRYMTRELLGTTKSGKKIYRYKYGKDSQTIMRRRQLLKPGGKKQGGASFKAYRSGATRRSR